MLAKRFIVVAMALFVGACAPQPAKRAVSIGGTVDAAPVEPDGSPPPGGDEHPDVGVVGTGGSPPDSALVFGPDSAVDQAPPPPPDAPPRPPPDAAPPPPDASPAPLPDAAPDAPPAPRAALIVSATTTLNALDTTLSMRMQAAGLTVTVTTPAAVTAADASGKALVMISGTIDSPMLGTKLRDVPVPVMSMEPNLMDDMNLSTDASTTSSQTQLAIVTASHPLAAGLTGTVAVYTGAASIVTGTPAAAATKVATVAGDASKVAIYGYDKGAAMVGGTPAPAKRVGYFINDNQGTIVLTADGLKLFDAALTWMMAP